MEPQTYSFQNLADLYETADDLPVVDRYDIYAYHDDADEWHRLPYRSSLWTDDGRATGDVAASDTFYNIIQYGEILKTVGTAVERQQAHSDLHVTGRVSLSPTAHKMTATIDFLGAPTVYAAEDDPINLGLQIQTGHSGFHALKYDVGAERQVCSNGMMAFIADLRFEQTHQDPFQPGLTYNAVGAILDSPAQIEQRITEAQDHELLNMDEALLVLLDCGLDQYLETPVPDLLNGLYEEVADPDAPSLWETYNAATRALTHYAQHVPDYERASGFEAAAALLENGFNELPAPDALGRAAVERRSQEVVARDDVEPYWEDEDDALKELMEMHAR